MSIARRMIRQIQKKWRWIALNLFALIVMISILRPVFGEYYLSRTTQFEILFDQSGRWGIRFLIISLAITPLYVMMGWRDLIPLRKPAGLWALAFVSVHVYSLLQWHDKARLAWQWFFTGQLYVLFGLIAGLVLLLMGLTSNRPAMRLLGKNWKRLHRLVYVAAILIILHINMATQSSKFAQPLPEYNLYFWLLLTLLLLRMPFIRDAIRHSQNKAKYSGKAKRKPRPS